jgi:hypothetical protein
MMLWVVHHDEAEVRSHIYCHRLVTDVCCSVTVLGCDYGPRGDGGDCDLMDPTHQLTHCDSHNSEI